MHFYGILNPDNDDGQYRPAVRVNRILSAAEARVLNEQDEAANELFGFDRDAAGFNKPGDVTERFDSFDDIVSALSRFVERNSLDIDEVYYRENVIWSLYQQGSGTRS
jgi:hypothetical protein